MKTSIRRFKRSVRRSAQSLALAVVLLGLASAPAAAAPSLAIELGSDDHEVQMVRIVASGGQFRLTFDGETTADISSNASAVLVRDAINALPSINSGGGSVSVAVQGATISPHLYFVSFDGGPLARADVPEMTVSDGTTPLSGFAGRASVHTVQPAGVSRSDERIDYSLTVANLLEVEAGNALTCDPKSWTGTPAPALSFQWLRDGVSLDADNGAQTGTYTVQAEDEGRSLQCQVFGTNTGATTTSVSAPAVVRPLPGTLPPAPNAPTNASSRPTIVGTGAATTKRTCRPPASWRGKAVGWGYQWLRNGAPIGGATGPEYQPVDAEDTGKVLQCQITGETAGGKAIGISNNNNVGTVSTPPVNAVGNTPSFPGLASPTSGEVTVELELPPGEDTLPLSASGAGWSCATEVSANGHPAKAVCQRSSELPPATSYPGVVVSVRPGSEVPDTAQAVATVAGGGGVTPSTDTHMFTFRPAIEFGIARFETTVPDESGLEETRAGAHPSSAGAIFSFPTYRRTAGAGIDGYGLIEDGRTIATDTPRGFVGNVGAVEELCPSVAEVGAVSCPSGSVVGGIEIQLRGFGPMGLLPVYAIEPEIGVPAQFAFAVQGPTGEPLIYTFAPRLRPEDNYAITLEAAPAPQNPELLGLPEVTICSFGADLEVPFGVLTFTKFAGCKQAGDPGASEKPLITLPTRCEGQPPTTVARIDSWQNKGVFRSKAFAAPPITECEAVEFDPEIELQPTSNSADSPTGLEVELTMPTEGLEGKDDNGDRNPNAISQANLKSARVTFPQGMAVNASAAHGLGACTSAQIGLGTDDPIACPESAKIGTVEVETPVLESTFLGDVYLAKQGDNPFGSLLAIYMVIESKRDGILVKLAGRGTPDLQTGQLVVSFDENPELPFSSLKMSFAQGPRSSLINPPRCGSYEIKTELTPWNAADPNNPTPDELVTQTSSFNVTSGPGGGPCPSGALEAGFNAGVTSPVAGQPSPFVMRLTREDGTQRFTALGLATPRGLVASLRGIPYCPDEVLAAISPAAGTGQAQVDNPSCPAASLIGHASAGAGAGPDPFYVNTPRAYLAGPYKGAPLSLALVTPAVAGPIDLGNVVVRTALHVNPETAQITAISDPIPHILHGILLNVRDIRVAIDRPNFTQNPTSCAEMAVNARVSGDEGGSANLANRFQVDNCAALGFKPDVTLRLVGGTKRGGHPSLRAVVRPRPGDANIRRAAVSLPRSAFLDQANIRTICTRVQWAQDNCPKAARYGFARAWSPLLDHPLQGPIYLRSSDNLLPDLVADLRGPAHQPIKIEAAFRTDSIRGGIRSTIDLAPDAPVSRFVLRMQGGKRKGLIVNSRDICRGTNRANSRMIGHNGRRENSRPKVHAANCGKARKGAKGKRGKGKANRQSLSNLRQVR